MHKPFTAR